MFLKFAKGIDHMLIYSFHTNKINKIMSTVTKRIGGAFGRWWIHLLLPQWWWIHRCIFILKVIGVCVLICKAFHKSIMSQWSNLREKQKNTTYFLSCADYVCVCLCTLVCVFIYRKGVMRGEEETFSGEKKKRVIRYVRQKSKRGQVRGDQPVRDNN